MKFLRSSLRNLAVGLLAAAFLRAADVTAATSAGDFRWAGDPEGGAPFVEADPRRPDQLVGFDVEIAELIARKINRVPQFINITFTSIDQSIERGDAEIGLSGIEDTPARRATMAPTIPYYEFREVLSVRNADRAQFRTLADLKGRRVGTLGGTIAYDILLNAEREFGVQPVSYDDDVHPYSDLVIGRIDAVLLDNVLAERRARAFSGFAIQPQSVAIGHYVGILAARNSALRDQINDILRIAMRDGTLESIFRKWRVWNDDQPRLYARLLAAQPVAAVTGFEASPMALTPWQTMLGYLPSLLRASLVTIVLSCLAMILAIVLGISIATGRVYGGRLMRSLLTGYVELMHRYDGDAFKA